jgi:hypothetical protein
MIKTLDFEILREAFVNRLFVVIENILRYHQCINEYFLLMNALLESPNVRNHPLANVNRYGKFLIIDIPGYLKSQPELRTEYFYQGLRIGELLDVFRTFGAPAEIVDFTLSDEFFKLLLG